MTTSQNELMATGKPTGALRRYMTSLIVVNVALIAGGIVVLAVGMWILTDVNYLSNSSMGSAIEQLLNTKEFALTAATIFVVFGSLSFAVSMVGCCGVLRQDKRLLSAHVALISVLIVGQLTGGVFASRNINVVDEYVSGIIMDDVIERYPESMYLSDEIMIKFACCGWNGHQDFVVSQFARRNALRVPRSCCRFGGGAVVKGTGVDNYADCAREAATPPRLPRYLVVVGCKRVLASALLRLSWAFLGTAICASLLHAFALAAALTYCVSVVTGEADVVAGDGGGGVGATSGSRGGVGTSGGQPPLPGPRPSVVDAEARVSSELSRAVIALGYRASQILPPPDYDTISVGLPPTLPLLQPPPPQQQQPQQPTSTAVNDQADTAAAAAATGTASPMDAISKTVSAVKAIVGGSRAVNVAK